MPHERYGKTLRSREGLKEQVIRGGVGYHAGYSAPGTTSSPREKKKLGHRGENKKEKKEKKKKKLMRTTIRRWGCGKKTTMSKKRPTLKKSAIQFNPLIKKENLRGDKKALIGVQEERLPAG